MYSQSAEAFQEISFRRFNQLQSNGLNAGYAITPTIPITTMRNLATTCCPEIMTQFAWLSTWPREKIRERSLDRVFQGLSAERESLKIWPTYGLEMCQLSGSRKQMDFERRTDWSSLEIQVTNFRRSQTVFFWLRLSRRKGGNCVSGL